jgi:hypothetical protein
VLHHGNMHHGNMQRMLVQCSICHRVREVKNNWQCHGVLLGIKYGAELRERIAVAKKSVGKLESS